MGAINIPFMVGILTTPPKNLVKLLRKVLNWDCHRSHIMFYSFVPVMPPITAKKKKAIQIWLAQVLRSTSLLFKHISPAWWFLTRCRSLFGSRMLFNCIDYSSHMGLYPPRKMTSARLCIKNEMSRLWFPETSTRGGRQIFIKSGGIFRHLIHFWKSVTQMFLLSDTSFL